MGISKDKLVDTETLLKLVQNYRQIGKKIVLTSGSWDILHVGHMRYLERAKEHGDILIVGVDSDKRIKKRKGAGRPIVPEDERIEMLSHLSYVDHVYLKDVNDPKNHLIKTVLPDILIVSETTGHTKKDYSDKQKYCGKLVIMERQAQTSTTARIRILHVDGQKKLAEQLIKEIPKLIEDILQGKK